MDKKVKHTTVKEVKKEKETRNARKTITGKVVSAKQQKTRVALIENYALHQTFKKRIRVTSRVQFHDENNETNVGDVVLLMETRPLSKTKRHRLVRVVEKSKQKHDLKKDEKLEEVLKTKKEETIIEDKGEVKE